jgi:DNA-binding transcriptional ArsR family regulator
MGNIAYNTKDPDATRRPTEAARLLAAMANPLRLQIIRQLLNDTACVTDFVDALGVDQPKVSQHLAVLRTAGVIRCRAEGRKRCYSAIWPERLRDLLGCVEALLAARAGAGETDDLKCNEL